LFGGNGSLGVIQNKEKRQWEKDALDFLKEEKMARNLFLYSSLLLAVVLFSSGCVNRATVNFEPTADLTSIKSIYVASAPDDWGTKLLIENKLKTMGYMVDAGADRPSNVDAVVTYVDKWMWDITMYMLELTITVRDPKNDFPLASGNSLHTSLTRLSPEKMVDEVINNIFKQVK